MGVEARLGTQVCETEGFRQGSETDQTEHGPKPHVSDAL